MNSNSKIYYIDDILYDKQFPTIHSLLKSLQPYLMLLRKEVDFEKTMLTRELLFIEGNMGRLEVEYARSLLLPSIESSISTTLLRNSHD